MPTIDNEDISVGLGEKIVAKGVVYAAVKKTEKGFTKTFHIFATHMRAWNSQTARETRQKQAKQMKEFVEAKNLPNNEPTLSAGDFNVDFVRCASELSDLAQILDAKLPELKGEQKYTSDPSSNILVGKDSAAKACLEADKSSWGEKKENVYHPIPQVKNPTPPNPPISKLDSFFADPTKDKETLYIEEGGCYAPCCLHEWLDYILISNRHQQPLNTPTLESIRLKAASPFAASWLWIDPPSMIEVVGKEFSPSTPKPDQIITSDLSDHYPVFSRFVFST
ncbi:MAG TPA: hypothetical protein DCS91_05120 [Microcoleaceae bacterium UBA11344]|jgi:Metal-dependent hydrolase|nr:hypothetical protein [Microcoleaceae cyanobacterium UBA11344]